MARDDDGPQIDCHHARLTGDWLSHVDDKRAMTRRLVEYTERRVLEDRFTHVAATIGVHEKTVRNVFADWRVRQERDHSVDLPRVLGLDEVYIGKHARAIMTNVEASTGVDLLEDPKDHFLANWFHDRGNARAAIQIVVTDMWMPYRQLIRTMLPQAVQVIDKSHVVKMANYCLDLVRKASNLDDNRRRRLMRERGLLFMRPERLTDGQRYKLDIWLHGVPLLKAAYEAKERFYRIYDEADRTKATWAFVHWRQDLRDELRLPFQIITTAFGNWSDEIFNYFDHTLQDGRRATNALTDGMNSRIRSTERMSQGLSFEVLRAKMLYLCRHERAVRRSLYGRMPDGTLGMITGPASRYIRDSELEIDLGVPITIFLRVLDEGFDPGRSTR